MKASLSDSWGGGHIRKGAMKYCSVGGETLIKQQAIVTASLTDPPSPLFSLLRQLPPADTS